MSREAREEARGRGTEDGWEKQFLEHQEKVKVKS